LSSGDDGTPFFGAQGEILFRESDGHANYLLAMNPDGSGRRKVIASSIISLIGISQDREWAVAMTPVDDEPMAAMVAVPLYGGTVRRICPGICTAR
jgi:hypothetical protein